MLKASYLKYYLRFKTPSGTSRGVLTLKETFFINIFDDEIPNVLGVGECAVFRGLSCDDTADYEDTLIEICNNIDSYKNNYKKKFSAYPSIIFGIETALKDLELGGNKILFPSNFTQGKDSIKINGLVWMGNKKEMYLRIKDKIDNGFSCIKIKIGSIDFDEELDLLKYIRNNFNSKQIEIRVDANGAFNPINAIEKLNRLSEFELHSIEQPIKQNQWQIMSELCEKSPLSIALDEELIGINNLKEKNKLLDIIKPQYIILKPSLHGGLCGSEEWIKLANEKNIKWWATSALESNIGLNAIAQWCYTDRKSVV